MLFVFNDFLKMFHLSFSFVLQTLAPKTLGMLWDSYPTQIAKVSGPHPADILRTQILQSLQGVSVEGSNDTAMGKLGVSFRRWCRQKGLEIPPVCWNMNLISRGESDKRNYPELDSNVKAVHTKTILFFLADVASDVAKVCQCTFGACFETMYFFVLGNVWRINIFF